MYAMIKATLKKRVGLELGGVREPLYNLIDEDMPKVDEAIAMINAAIEKYCWKQGSEWQQ